MTLFIIFNNFDKYVLPFIIIHLSVYDQVWIIWLCMVLLDKRSLIILININKYTAIRFGLKVTTNKCVFITYQLQNTILRNNASFILIR